MPITLEKLFSATVSSSFEYMGETVNMVWAPARYTGEMWDLAEKMDNDLEAAQDDLEQVEGDDPTANAERVKILRRARNVDRHGVRKFLSELLVSWDVMDGKKPYATDEASLARLDPDFVALAFLSLAGENTVDPQKAPGSNGRSRTPSSARSRRGSSSSGEPTTSGSPRGT